MTKKEILDVAVKIAKQAARGGNANPSSVLLLTFNTICELVEKHDIPKDD
jgi:hypothetical protein